MNRNGVKSNWSHDFSRTFGLVQAFRWSPDVMTLTQENKTRNLTSLNNLMQSKKLG